MTVEERDTLIQEWYTLEKDLAFEKLRLATKVLREMELRKQIVAMMWPMGQGLPGREGTNNSDIGNGWILKGTIKIERKVDEAALPAVREQLQKMLINPDTLIKNTPELKTKEYRLLTEEQRLVMDTALVIKPGSPTLELIPPKPV